MYKIYAVNHDSHQVYYRTSYDNYYDAVTEAILSSEHNNACTFEIVLGQSFVVKYRNGNIVTSN